MLTVIVLSALGLLGLNLLLATAVLMLRLRNEMRARSWDRLERHWQPAILELLAGGIAPSELRARVKDREVLRLLDVCARFARRVAGPDRAALGAFAGPLLPRLGERLEAPRPTTRARAAQTLSILGFDEHAEDLVSALDDPSPLVAMVAAQAIARHRDPRYVPALLDRLDRFEMWSSAFLASMLASMGSAIAPALRDHLVDRTRPASSRDVAARALAVLRDIPSGDVAAATLDEATEPELIAGVLRLLQAVGHSRHLPAVRALLGHEDFTVRAHAASALGRFGTKADGGRLLSALDDSSAWVVLHAAQALARLGDEEALRRVAAGSGDRAVVAAEVLSGAAA